MNQYFTTTGSFVRIDGYLPAEKEFVPNGELIENLYTIYNIENMVYCFNNINFTHINILMKNKKKFMSDDTETFFSTVMISWSGGTNMDLHLFINALQFNIK